MSRAVLYFILSLYFFSRPIIAHAQQISCTTEPDYKGPFSSLFNDPQNDCSVHSHNYDDPLYKDWWEHAQVKCSPNAVQDYDLVSGHVDDLNDAPLNGGADGIGTDFFPNIALSNNLFTQFLENFTPRARRLINYKDSFDPGTFNLYCYYKRDQYPTLEACIQEIENYLPSTDGDFHENVMAVGSTLEKLTTVEDRLKMLRDTCNDIITPCCNGTAPESTLCSHVWWIDDKTNVCDVCGGGIPQDAETYFQLSEKNRLKFVSIEFVKTLRKAALVVAPNVNLDWIGPASYMLEGFLSLTLKPAVADFYIPGLVGTLHQGSEQLFQLVHKVDEGPQYIKEIKDELRQPIGSGGCGLIKDLDLIQPQSLRPDAEKVNAFAPCMRCDSVPQEDAQHAGGAHEAVGNQGISLGFSLEGVVLKAKEFLSNKIFHFSAWYVLPGELSELDQQQNGDKNAYSNAFLTLETINQKQTSKPMKIPLKTAPKGHGVAEKDPPRPRPSATETPEPAEADGLGSSGPYAFSDGGTERFTDIWRRNSLLPKDDYAERWQDACWLPPLLVKAQGTVFGGAITAVAQAVGAFSASSVCPDRSQFPSIFGGVSSSGPNPPTSGACWNGDMGSLMQDGSCKLTKTHIGVVNNIPQTMKAIFEHAGATYKVPPDLIAGVMYSEGGFEPRTQENSCYGPYTDESILAGSTCGNELNNCSKPGCNNDIGSGRACLSYGPYQTLVCNGDVSFNPCNFYEATMFTAKALATYRIGASSPASYTDPRDQQGPGGTPGCLGYAYNSEQNNNGLPSSCGAESWTCEDVITAIRFRKGWCIPYGSGSFDQVLQIYGRCQR